MSLVAYDSSDSDGSVEETLPVLSVPKKGNKRQAGPVKICLPSLDKKGLADSDEDEDLVPQPKRKPGGSGLTALLPQPKLAPSKLVARATPTVTPSSQDMVPYSLSRHGRAALNARTAARRDIKKAMRQGKVAKDNRSHDNSDSDDDDDEPVSFFSHLNTSRDQPVAEISEGVVTNVGVANALGGQDQIQAAPNAPRPFTQEVPSTIDPALVTHLWEESVAGSDDYVAVESEPDPKPHPLPIGVPAALPGAGPGLSMDEEAYRRLTGVRKKRGRDPALNDLIEIKEDDVKVGMETYRKNFTEESVEKMYKAPDGSKPTAQQKKKHQLSFLAHHAKENELKLLKQWAQSSATRRDTQMKYGF